MEEQNLGMTNALGVMIDRALGKVNDLKHEFIMPEHLLLVMLENEALVLIMEAMEIDRKGMR